MAPKDEVRRTKVTLSRISPQVENNILFDVEWVFKPTERDSEKKENSFKQMKARSEFLFGIPRALFCCLKIACQDLTVYVQVMDIFILALTFKSV